MDVQLYLYHADVAICYFRRGKLSGAMGSSISSGSSSSSFGVIMRVSG